VPSLASTGNHQLKVRLREKLAEAETLVTPPAPIAIPRPTPQQAIAQDGR
jgi:hypothetical protein